MLMVGPPSPLILAGPLTDVSLSPPSQFLMNLVSFDWSSLHSHHHHHQHQHHAIWMANGAFIALVTSVPLRYRIALIRSITSARKLSKTGNRTKIYIDLSSMYKQNFSNQNINMQTRNGCRLIT